MPNPRHICFFTGKRGGFTHLIPILKEIESTEGLEYSVVAADMHLSDSFGKTIDEVEKWSKRFYKIDTLLSSNSRVSRAKSIGIGIMGFVQLLERLRPDFVFALGDRGEVLGWVISAMELNIPVIHLFGGDVTQGGVDEPVRHAITKMANIHLTSNQESADRIIKMGEEKWRVHNVGSPVLDLIAGQRFTQPEQIQKKFNLNLQKPIIVLLQHSVTWQVEKAEYQIWKTMEAIDHFGYQTIAVYPCADPGCEQIINVLSEYANKSYFQLYKNIEFQDFWGLMNVSSIFMGNSSAGVMETASFKIPFINIGIRQEGRLRADNVIDVDHNSGKIIQAVHKAIHDQEFKEKVTNCISPYGDGRAAERIVTIIKKLDKTDSLLRKKCTY